MLTKESLRKAINKLKQMNVPTADHYSAFVFGPSVYGMIKGRIPQHAIFPCVNCKHEPKYHSKDKVSKCNCNCNDFYEMTNLQYLKWIRSQDEQQSIS